MKAVRVRNLIIGEGRPKICVPIVGRTKAEIIEQTKLCLSAAADMVEWRADWFEQVEDSDAVQEMLITLRNIVKEMPVLFTFRTKNEGGEKEIEPAQYLTLLQETIRTGMVDLVDVEVYLNENVSKEIIKFTHEHCVKVIASNHDFEGTPSKEEIIHRLCYMQELHADILKIAVMPKNRQDVLTLLAATEEMERKDAKSPLVTMSMGGFGVISRCSGEIFGSSITFGAAEKASAPGQLEVSELKKILDTIHKAL